jgi:hypothetical protein
MKRSTGDLFARLVLAASLLSLAAPAAGQHWRFGVDADYLHDDNVTRGLDPDKRSDDILGAEAFAARSFYLGPKSGLVLRGGLRYSHFTDFKDLSNLGVGGRAAYRVQPFDAGFSSPWFELAGDLWWLRHSDSALRDGTIATLSGSIGSYLTDRLRGTAGIGILNRKADDPSGLFNQSQNRLFATLDWRIGIRNVVYARLSQITGDQHFSAADPASQGMLVPISEVIVFDPALQRGYSGGLTPFSYRTEATTQVYELGFNYPLGGPHTLDFGAAMAKSKTDNGGYKYDANQLRISYFYRFQ